MSEDKYDNYTDDDFLVDLNAYADQRDAEQAEDNAELKQHLGEMVGGFLGVWWYLRAFGAASSRNIRTYAAVADKKAKLTAWETADDQINQEHPHFQSKVTIMNEFGACSKCLPYLGNEYTLAEAKSLVPFHYNCRCTIVRVKDTLSDDLPIATGIAVASKSRKDEDEDGIIDLTDYVPEVEPTTYSEHKPMLKSKPGTAIKTYATKSGLLQRIRIYGPDGNVLKDIDFTNHGISEPEVHDWIINPDTGKRKRTNGRKMTSKEANYIEGIE